MELWVWLSAYLVGFVVLQVLLYRYVIGHSGSRSGGTTTESGIGTAGLARTSRLVDVEYDQTGEKSTEDSPGAIDADEAVCCDVCGVQNKRDQTFTYCRNCGERL